MEVDAPGISVQSVGQNTMVVSVRSDPSEWSMRNIVKLEGSRITRLETVGSSN